MSASSSRDSRGFESGRTAWDAWYGQHGDRVISTRSGSGDESVFLASGRADLELLQSEHGLPTGGAIHEIGCGSGRMTVHLVRRYEHVTANDISSAVLEACAERVGDSARLMLGGPARMTEIGSDTVDAVVSVATLQHVASIEEIEAYVTETTRILRPGGRAVLQLASASPYRHMRDLAVDRVRSTSWGLRRMGEPAPSGKDWRGCSVSDASLMKACDVAGGIALIEKSRLYRWLAIDKPA